MAFYAFYSYLNLKFELAPVYLNPASFFSAFQELGPGQYLFSNLALKNDMGKVTQSGRELEGEGAERGLLMAYICGQK